ncbi:cell surface protein SprA [Taibaiella sp. KBW10]|nr:cell surface protein SprA [Taibaiella sp. KBW10]
MSFFVATFFVVQIATGGLDPMGAATEIDADEPLDEPEDISPSDTLKFPTPDKKTAGPDTSAASRFGLSDPKNLKKEVEYDPDSNKYIFTEKIGGENVKDPYVMDFNEYYKYQTRKDENEYFGERLSALGMFNKKPDLPVLYKDGVFDRLFGNTKLDIKPQGNLTILAGFYSQNLKNPNIPLRSQKYTVPDFDMMMNVQLVAKIGDKMKLNISNNTLSNFGDMQEMRKLEYSGKDDEIIKKIELGNVSFPLRSSLISGVSSLFGAKAQLQFGKLWVTGVVSQQKSQRRSMTVKGGAQTLDFEIMANDYEENKHFLLGQYFYNNYDKALQNFPIINSQAVISKVEVWVTNRTGSTQGIRDALAFMDLGEANPYNTSLVTGSTTALPDNRANALYNNLQQNPIVRMQSTASQGAISLGLKEGNEFQRVTLRKLNDNEYNFQPQLGYVSINTTPNADDVIAVAYRYTYNGKVYQVGEFSEELPPDSTSQKVIFLKLLKGTSARVTLPIWNLMMKNVYALQGVNISKDKFRLNVVYQDPGGGNKRFLPEGPQAGVPLISLLNLDRLNPQNDPGPDGVFDYVEGITINSQQGKVMFPTLQPFGSSLKPALGGNPALENKYLYQILYDSTKTVAIQQQQNNRFLITGEYQSSGGGAEIRLNGFNIPQGSVTVSAGGQKLMEGTDYQIDYSMGVVKMLNQGILNSGVPINISYEDNAAFGQNVQNFMGTRLDYYASDKLTLGATYMRLTERPYTQKVISGYDPIKNTVLGADMNYQSELPGLTRALDKILPFYSTSAPSLISASAEVAGIFPGHSKFINGIAGDEGGTVYVDDFEGAANSYDLRYPVNSWTLSSIPFDATGPTNNILFPEANASNDLKIGYNRANLAWYNIEPVLNGGGTSAPQSVRDDTVQQDYWRQVPQVEVFPKKSVISTQSILTTFDLNYNPKIRGPYNFDPTNVNPATGELLNPSGRWGGIQRAIEQSDFEQTNVEYITFWMLDPFMYNGTSRGGYLYFNLGNVSEDVLKDSRLSFENGVPYPKDPTKLDETVWGRVPKFQQQIVRAFDQQPNAREVQDVGYDELDDQDERQFFESSFLGKMRTLLGPTSDAYLKLQEDPASDNFKHFYATSYDTEKASILKRYRYFNNPQGNAPILSGNNATTTAGSSIPESEDINRDNTLNEIEAYYQYRVKIEPNMVVGTTPYLVDKNVATNVKLPDGRVTENTWYQFKIPIRSYSAAVGGISDFRSIRFMRMFLNGFEDSVVMRFAQLQLDRSIWRKYNFSLTNPGEPLTPADIASTPYGLTTVSVDQNSFRTPVKYVSPPGILKQQQLSTTGQQFNADEQSLSLQVCGLKDGDSRAVFKEVGTDMRQYKELKMFIHAESVEDQQALRDGDVTAFIRIGSDYVRNYYEYQVPLKITEPGAASAEAIWPLQNNLHIILQDLVDLKSKRNSDNFPVANNYDGLDRNGRVIRVIGNPNIGEVKNIMLGVLNPKKTPQTPADDGLPKCTEVWFDELRNVGLDEKAGYAASGQVNVQLADFGSVHVAGTMHTKGYGSIDQRVNDRFRDDYYQYQGNANLNLGKIMPKNWGVQLPVFIGYNQSTSNPEYDPYDVDISLTDKLRTLSGQARTNALQAAQDYNSITSFNITNMRILGNPAKQKKPMPWSAKNFDLSYSYLRQFNRNPLIQSNEFTDQKMSLGYTYALTVKPFEPFKKRIKSKSVWLQFIKDFNINYLPNTFTFRSNLDRTFSETILRDVDDGGYPMPAYYYKNFVWNRNYNLRWDLTRSLSVNYQAANISRIDEPYGRINTGEKRDSLYNKILGLGRNTYFSQKFDVAYTLPTKKFPFLDWTSANIVYNATYDWTAASLLAHSQGNVITNTQLKQINGELNFGQLYNKNRYLKAVNRNAPTVLKNGNSKLKGKMMNDMEIGVDKVDPNKPPVPKGDKNLAVDKNKSKVPPRPERKTITVKDVKGSDTMKLADIGQALKQLRKAERIRYRKAMIAWRKAKQNILPEIGNGEKFLVRLATMVKRVNVDYTENMGTILPGYMDSTNYLGANFRNRGNGLDFALGYQPSRYWLDQQMKKGNLSSDSLFNGMYQQTYTQTYNIRAVLEPVQDFRIDLNWSSNFTRNQSEINKYNEVNGVYERLNPYYTGSFSATYIGVSTLFQNAKAGELTSSYREFMANRQTISNRLGNTNPYTNGIADPNDPNYKKGYTGFSQDVLIPAFIAAYSGKSATNIPLMKYDYDNIKSNPFKFYIPMPNWKISYTGLSNVAPFSDILNTFTLNHNYSGKMSMNSFANSLYYSDLLGVGFPSFIDSNSNNYVPFFQVPNMTITENFGPLLGFNASFKNDLSIRLDYGRSRTVSLSLIDYQVSETRSTEWIIGMGYRIKGLVLPFSLFGVKKLKNDLNIKFDFSYRDDITSNTYMALNENRATMGQKVIAITPTIDYIINDNLQLQFYFDRRQSFPHVYTSFPLTSTKGGLKLTFTFAGQ